MTGAVAAGSCRSAHVMAEGIGLKRVRLVLELGPGTGVFADAILARLAPAARHVTVSGPVDAVISGLPWTVMPRERRVGGHTEAVDERKPYIL
ncbi:hypothetical protein ABT150_42990 [Streptomyces mirabilis]|uniref:hypothetical protein n=1 Tax=Streptomyces mirabilis TaxID=68239 RepID=UPI00331DDA94